MLKVVIADDERIVRRTVRAIGMWEENGMEIAGEAADGLEALALIEREKPDILFLDMRMPGMSGAELLKALEDRGLALAVVIISGYDDFEYARTALKYGAADYMLKPIDRLEFNRLLQKLAKKCSGGMDKPDPAPPPRDAAAQVKEKIDREYAGELSLAGLAEEFYINRDVLSRLFKKRYGTGIISYINEVRLEQGKALLLLGYSVTQASELVGYHDVNYFSRIFKKKYGMSPREFIEADGVRP